MSEVRSQMLEVGIERLPQRAQRSGTEAAGGHEVGDMFFSYALRQDVPHKILVFSL